MRRMSSITGADSEVSEVTHSFDASAPAMSKVI